MRYNRRTFEEYIMIKMSTHESTLKYITLGGVRGAGGAPRDGNTRGARAAARPRPPPLAPAAISIFSYSQTIIYFIQSLILYQ